MIAISEWFVSFQGEGLRTGQPSVFIRTGGCPVACKWCDTTGWGGYGDWKVFKRYDTLELVKEIAETTNCRWAVLTGGEPTIQPDLPLLIEALHYAGFQVAIETSGAVKYEPVWKYVQNNWLEYDQMPNHITLSPKDSIVPEYPALDEWFYAANEFKVVIDRVDHPALDRVLAWRRETGRTTPIYLQPEFTEMERWTQRCMELMEEDPTLRLSLQTHKWVGAR